MECSILSEVDDTSFSGRGSPRRYGRPLNWLPASNLLPAQRAGAQRLCALALNGCAGLSPNISVVGGQPAVPAAVPDLLSLSNRWHLDEMVVGIAGDRMYLWRAVDHEGRSSA